MGKMAVQKRRKPELTMRVFRFRHRRTTATIGSLMHRTHTTQTPILRIYRSVDEYNREHGTNLRVIGPREANDLFEILLGHRPTITLPRPVLVNVAETTWGNRHTLEEDAHFPANVIVGYKKPGEVLGSEIIYPISHGRRIILSVPGSYKTEKDRAIVATNLDLKNIGRDGRDIMINTPVSDMRAVHFPTTDGYYFPQGRTAVPHTADASGYKIKPIEVYLRRIEGPYVGHIFKGSDDQHQSIVYTFYPPGDHQILVQISARDLRTMMRKGLNISDDLVRDVLTEQHRLESILAECGIDTPVDHL